jgi:hypothetical protein
MRRDRRGHFGAGLFRCEHPIDAGAGGVALLLPSGDLADQAVEVATRNAGQLRFWQRQQDHDAAGLPVSLIWILAH